jgi:hypothetical protein
LDHQKKKKKTLALAKKETQEVHQREKKHKRPLPLNSSIAPNYKKTSSQRNKKVRRARDYSQEH